LNRIRDEQLAPELEALLGADFLAAVTQGTSLLGEAIGTSSAPLPTALKSFAVAVNWYARTMCTIDEDDPVAVETFKRALERSSRTARRWREPDRSGPTTTTTSSTRPEPPRRRAFSRPLLRERKLRRALQRATRQERGRRAPLSSSHPMRTRLVSSARRISTKPRANLHEDAPEHVPRVARREK
jgi:hypothetical protein